MYFTSNMEPSGSELNCPRGYTCIICGHWEEIIDVVEVKNAKFPKDDVKKGVVLATHKVEEGIKNRNKIIKLFEYITFLRERGTIWNEIGVRLRLSPTAVKTHYKAVVEERSLNV